MEEKLAVETIPKEFLNRNADDELKRVGIFGSSLNPPTLAHVTIVKKFAHQLDYVLIVPVFRHMFWETKGVHLANTSYQQRLEMAQLAFASKSVGGATNVRISNIEEVLQKDPNSPKNLGMIDVLSHLREKTPPNVEYCLILGGDTCNDLVMKKWKNSDEILRTTNLLVFSRAGILLDDSSKRKNIERYTIEELEPVSSTDARIVATQMNACQNDADIISLFDKLSSFVPPVVARYIQDKKLYS